MKWELYKLSVLHIGGGHFFHKGISYKEIPESHKHHFIKVEESNDPSGSDLAPELDEDAFTSYSEEELNKMNKHDHEEIIVKLNGKPSTAKKPAERIELILKLQEELDQLEAD